MELSLAFVIWQSASPASPSSSPGNFAFNAINNMTTCTSGLITWNYTGVDAKLVLSVTNLNVNQYLVVPPIAGRQNAAGQTINQQLAVTNASLQAGTNSGFNAISHYLLWTILPRERVGFIMFNWHFAAIFVGASRAVCERGVIGAVVAVALLVLAVLLMRRRRSQLKVETMGVTSHVAGGIAPRLTSNPFHSQSESTTGMQQDVAGTNPSANTTPGGSDEDMGEEKIVSPASPGMSPFEVLDTPVHYARRASMYSLQSPTTPTTIADNSRSRETSVPTSNQSLEQQAHRIRSSMESSLYLRTERLSMPIIPPTAFRTPTTPTAGRPKDEYPPSPFTPPSPVIRSPSAGDMREDSASTAPSAFSAVAESSHSHGTGVGTEAQDTPSQLSHKASFGNGRPIHYLIPDMPPPQQD
ncbi:hypothetical protein BU15DRAFT_77373 [Melanogaster broomeanus]|nr:hypothetical protein BU15DRAFT_77373 [Melanogaster broomeanus]